MIDPRIDSIIYQSQVYYTNLVNKLVDKKKLGKVLDSSWEKADTILGYLEALNFRSYLTEEEDINNVNYILDCLIVLCELNQYPQSAPIEFQPAPAVLVGVEGPPGESIIGPQGPAGLATDFQESLITVPIEVDSFNLTDAKGARWDYIVRKSTGEQRAGHVIASWKDDGLALEMYDSSTEDIQGSTADLVFSVQHSSGTISLVATPLSGSWEVIGTRYFIPNNGNGTGPISGALANGTIYIGNPSNQAQSQSVSGAISITNAGVTSLNPGVITNNEISAGAAIALSKLATVTANRLLLSNGAGQIIASTITDVEAGHLSGVTSPIQTQLNSKLSDPMTTIGDMIIRNGSNVTVRLGIGTNGQVLTVAGGIPSWSAIPGGISGLTTNFLPKATSATTLGNSIISETTGAITIAGTTELQGGYRTEATGVYFKIKQIDIGDWNMDSTATKAVAHGLSQSAIRAVNVVIRNDTGTSFSDPTTYDQTITNASALVGWNSSNIVMTRTVGSIYDGTAYDLTPYNRGWITIIYEA